jgi:uncharacterized protein YbjT (DUF2867 family)
LFGLVCSTQGRSGGLLKAVIAGASGLVGSSCLQKLLSSGAYSEVISVGRRSLPVDHPRLQQLVTELAELPKYRDQLQADHYFCCLGTTIKVAKSKEAFKRVDFEAPLELGRIALYHLAKHFLIVTAMGANAGSLFFYNQVKGQIEEDLQALNLPALTIFRPSLLVGQRAQPRLAEQIFEKAKYLPIWWGVLKNFKPVNAERVADAMVRAAMQPPPDAVRIINSSSL